MWPWLRPPGLRSLTVFKTLYKVTTKNGRRSFPERRSREDAPTVKLVEDIWLRVMSIGMDHLLFKVGRRPFYTRDPCCSIWGTGTDMIRFFGWLIVSLTVSGPTIGSGFGALGMLFVAWSHRICFVAGVLLARLDFLCERSTLREHPYASRSGPTRLTGGSFDLESCFWPALRGMP